MFKEFKEFAMKGNVLDMAVGIIIGGAFGKIVGSLVNDVMMPPIGKLFGGVDFSNLYINLSGQAFSSLEAAKAAGAPTINYGVFLNNIIQFLIVALAVFLLVKGVSQLKRQEPTKAPAAPTTKVCGLCCSSIPIKAVRCAYCTAELAGAAL